MRTWHTLSHNGDGSLKAELSRQDRTKIYAWHAEQLAYLIQRLKQVPEGNGSLFDNTAILYCSEMSNGSHNSTNIPFLLAGTAGGRFRNGAFFDETNAAKGERTTYRWNNDLLAAIGKGYGLEIDSFGSADRTARDQYSKGPYARILA
jgi:hypothetical protein